jgi:CheY-like chemotaxis protein
MDWVLPQMDGLEAIACLRHTPKLGELPIIMISASASGGDEQSALAAGANAFLSKPVDEGALLEHIGGLLRIEWHREISHVEAGSSSHPVAPLVIPPKEQMEVLHQLALQGSMRDIAQMAADLNGLDERYGPFADQLLLLTSRFQSKAVLAFVEQHLERAQSARRSVPLQSAARGPTR